MVKIFKIKLLKTNLYLGIFFLSFTRIIHFQMYKISTSEVFEQIQESYKANDAALVEILKAKFIDPPSLKSYNLSHDPLYKQTKNFFSWPFIYYFTKNLFDGYVNGFFVEAGALDGEYLSNTLWLEKELNWTGLLIEPDPNNYKDLLLKNRKSWTSKTCISSEYPKKTIFVSRRRTADMYHTNKWIFRGSSHEYGYSNDSKLEFFLSRSTPTYYSVQCFPLLTYLLALNKTTIDFLSLDIQGSEMDVLKSFPFDQINVRLMAIEYSNTDRYDKNFVQFFNERGYELIGCFGEPDYIFIRKDLLKTVNFKKILKCRGI